MPLLLLWSFDKVIFLTTRCQAKWKKIFLFVFGHILVSSNKFIGCFR